MDAISLSVGKPLEEEEESFPVEIVSELVIVNNVTIRKAKTSFF